jgi:molybdopterin-guanine dinucleotide biosynthesis protein A
VKSKLREISAYIIAGGQSKRFGSDKARYRFMGKELILHVYDLISRIFENIILVSHSDMEDLLPGVERIEDLIPDLGPIGGIHTALVHSDNPIIFAVACDMPFLNADFIRFMTGFIDDHDVVIPGDGDKLEPLHALYSTKCKKEVERVIEEGGKRIVTIFENQNVKIIGSREMAGFSNSEKMFFNINSLEDVEENK